MKQINAGIVKLFVMIFENTIEEYFMWLNMEVEQLTSAIDEAGKNNLHKMEKLCRNRRDGFIRSLKKLTRITVRDLMIDEIIRK